MSGIASIRRIHPCGIWRIGNFLDVGTNTPYLLDGYGVLGKSSLFIFVDQSIVYGVSLMWIWRILQTQYEEVRRKSMRDFHKTHPSGSGTVTKTALRVAKIKPSVTNEGTGVKPGVPDSNSEHETNENELGSESDQEENEEDEDDEEEVKYRLVKTLSNDFDDEDETKITDKVEGDEDEEIDYTTSQLYDDVDIRLNEPISQVIEDAHVTISTVPQKTKVPVTSSSHSSDLTAKFLNFSDIPHTNAEIVSPMDVHVHHEVPSKQTPTLLTVPVSVITNSSSVYSTGIPQSLPSFTPPPQ
ncbi:hypothetical protein Tco_1521651 [Tanacetum coccineum]